MKILILISVYIVMFILAKRHLRIIQKNKLLKDYDRLCDEGKKRSLLYNFLEKNIKEENQK